jgi:hypothetical protein
VRDPSHPYASWFQLGKGIAEYRAGNDKGAIEWLERAAPGVNGSGHAAATCGFIRTMALHRLGRHAEATESFDAAERRWTSLGNTLGEDDLADSDVENWLVCQVLRREAITLLGNARTHAAATQPVGRS